FASFPERLTVRTAPSSITATPAESSPRYSRRARPWRATATGREEGAWARGPAYPTIPHMRFTLATAPSDLAPASGSMRVLRHDQEVPRMGLPDPPQDQSQMSIGWCASLIGSGCAGRSAGSRARWPVGSRGTWKNHPHEVRVDVEHRDPFRGDLPGGLGTPLAADTAAAERGGRG